MKGFWYFVTAFATGLMLCAMPGLAGCGLALHERIVRPKVTVLESKGEGRYVQKESIAAGKETAKRFYRLKLRNGETVLVSVNEDGTWKVVETHEEGRK